MIHFLLFCLAADVIGVVENPGQVSTIRTRHGDRRVHKFQVTDGHIFVRVTLLGSILDSSNTLFTANLQAPIVVVLAGVRVKRIPGYFRRCVSYIHSTYNTC